MNDHTNLDTDDGQRFIEGDGTPDADWQAWGGLAALPLLDVAALVPPGARAVIVAPHPDDEMLGCGGLLQALAAQRSRTLLVAVTDGAASHPGSPLWPPHRLACARPLETGHALDVLGLAGTQVIRARLPDGDVAAHAPQLQTMLQQLLRPGDVVFATWRLDGHPDHEASGHAAALAARACRATLVELPIWSWHWAAPGDVRIPWRRARRLVLSSERLRRKRDAIHCYHSQLRADPSTGRPSVLPPTVLERLLHPYEIYFL
ncbi:PIG-L family deacetylase [Rugamonas sp.]|uniref:PIG-L deacetylase family protein n=1 Tax=Rugamonas sp. TaxID=1926287 RepID=UPI0025FBD5FE|nr:PIG-L family deacetylase [Rugamonas sp.]